MFAFQSFLNHWAVLVTHFRLFFVFLVTLVIVALAGCAAQKPPPEPIVITKTEYVMVDVPATYYKATPITSTKPSPNQAPAVALKPPKGALNPTQVTPASAAGCLPRDGQVDWKACATERAGIIASLYGDIGQCNADKYRISESIKEQAAIVKERNARQEGKK